MLYENNEDIRDAVEVFTATHASLMTWFNKMLDGFLSRPYFALLEDMYGFMRKTEEIRERKVRENGYEFNHRIETSYLVRMYAYSGAIQMLDPMMMASRDEVVYRFAKAYSDLNKSRNEANRERRERSLAGIKVINYDPAILIKIRIDREVEQQDEMENPDFEMHMEETQLTQYLEALKSLTPVQRRVYDELAANPYMTHSEIAKEKLGMDPAHLCRTLRRIEDKFSTFLK